MTAKPKRRPSPVAVGNRRDPSRISGTALSVWCNHLETRLCEKGLDVVRLMSTNVGEKHPEDQREWADTGTGYRWFDQFFQDAPSTGADFGHQPTMIGDPLLRRTAYSGHEDQTDWSLESITHSSGVPLLEWRTWDNAFAADEASRSYVVADSQTAMDTGQSEPFLEPVYQSEAYDSPPRWNKAELFEKLRSYANLHDNWDYDGAKAPTIQAAEDAIAFLEAKPDDIPWPRPQVGDGEIGIYWREAGVFVDVSFSGNKNTYEYLGECKPEGSTRRALHCYNEDAKLNEPWPTELTEILNTIRREVIAYVVWLQGVGSSVCQAGMQVHPIQENVSGLRLRDSEGQRLFAGTRQGRGSPHSGHFQSIVHRRKVGGTESELFPH